MAKTKALSKPKRRALMIAQLMSAPGTGGGVLYNETMQKTLKELGIDPAMLIKMQPRGISNPSGAPTKLGPMTL